MALRLEQSILSHGEQDVAGHLKEGASIPEIADSRGASEQAVEQAIDRIEAKTDRAFATLLQSPFLEDSARTLSTEQRHELMEALDRAADDE